MVRLSACNARVSGFESQTRQFFKDLELFFFLVSERSREVLLVIYKFLLYKRLKAFTWSYYQGDIFPDSWNLSQFKGSGQLNPILRKIGRSSLQAERFTLDSLVTQWEIQPTHELCHLGTALFFDSRNVHGNFHDCCIRGFVSQSVGENRHIVA